MVFLSYISEITMTNEEKLTLCNLFHCCFPTGDFNRQLLGQMMQMNQLLGDVKDLLRQQVMYRGFGVKYPSFAPLIESAQTSAQGKQ